jgi:flagellar biosynthesis anti-sigma factor FlgM
MKIDANRSGLEAAGFRADRTGDAAGKAGTSRQQPAADRVSLSATAELAREAAQAAGQAPDIRQDLVDRMRALRAAGQLDADPERLADAMIDHMVIRRGKP